MRTEAFAVPVKVWAVFCTIVGISLTADTLHTCVLAVLAFGFLMSERRWKLVLSFGAFYAALALLLYFIRFYGLHMVLFSEFYVLMFYRLMPVFLTAWNLITTPPGQLSAVLLRLHVPSSVILGLLVVFRFFPTMKSEWKGLCQSMKNRHLTGAAQILRHPAVSCEYVLVPLLLRCLQIADQLSVSAVARGAQAPGPRGSYYAGKIRKKDAIWTVAWTAGTGLFLIVGGIK